jgi:hypothetical protein
LLRLFEFETMKKNRPRTRGRKYHRGKYWIKQRDAAFERAGHICEVSGKSLAGKVIGFIDGQPITKWARAADHIVSERFCRRFIPGSDPHILENLAVITPSLHAKKTAIERKIYAGDWIGYCQELRAIGFDQVIIDRALAALNASAKGKA